MNVIFDMDGTLCLIDHRLHHITTPNKDWNAFHDGCDRDDPNEAIIKVAQAMYTAGHRVTIITARPESCRAKTEEWLQRHNVRYHDLSMRADGDYRRDDIVKEEIFKKVFTDDCRSTQLFCAFEDRKRVVDMWRRNGVVCIQVNEGDF